MPTAAPLSSRTGRVLLTIRTGLVIHTRAGEEIWLRSRLLTAPPLS